MERHSTIREKEDIHRGKQRWQLKGRRENKISDIVSVSDANATQRLNQFFMVPIWRWEEGRIRIKVL